LSPRVETAQGHRQHSNCQKQAEDGIRLEPPVEFVRIPQIVISHDGPLPIETSHELLDIGGKKLVDRPNTKPQVEDGKPVTSSAQPNWAS
jgi:hypothetical protein